MAGRWEELVVIDRPIQEVFAFLPDGENDLKFSPRVLEIAKTTDGPPAVGTVFARTVRDAGEDQAGVHGHRTWAAPLGFVGRRCPRTSSLCPKVATTSLGRAPGPGSPSTTSRRARPGQAACSVGVALRPQGRERLRQSIKRAVDAS